MSKIKGIDMLDGVIIHRKDYQLFLDMKEFIQYINKSIDFKQFHNKKEKERNIQPKETEKDE